MRNLFDIRQLILSLTVLAVLAILATFAFSQPPPPVPSFAQPQSQQPVYMVRAWTPVRNLLGWGPLYRPYVAIGPATPATVTPVAPLGVAR